MKAVNVDEVLKIIHKYGEYVFVTDYKIYTEMQDEIANLKAIEPQPKMGRWLHREIMDYLDKNKVRHNHFMCQDCGFIHDFIDGHTAQYEYCPNCGAKMVKSQAESEEEE